MINATLSNNKLLPFCLSSLDVGLLFARTARIARTFAPPRTPHCLPLTCLTYWCCVPGLAMRPTLRMSNANIPKIIKHRWLAFVCVACVCVCVCICACLYFRCSFNCLLVIWNSLDGSISRQSSRVYGPADSALKLKINRTDFLAAAARPSICGGD